MKALLSLLAATLLAGLAAPARGADLIGPPQWLEMTHIERRALEDDSGKLSEYPTRFTPFNTARPPIPRRVEAFVDRREYLGDDPVGQFLVYFIGQNHQAAGAKLVLSIVAGESGAGKELFARTLAPVPSPKVAGLFEVGQLPPGTYRLRARLEGVPGARVIPDAVFKKSAQKRQVLPFPKEGVPLLVHEQSFVPDLAWPITTGVPLPQHASNSIDEFILTENGKEVPAQFSVRSKWYPDREIKWMGLDFVARYDNGKPRSYKVVKLAQARQAPGAAAGALKITQSDEQIVVDTGAIRFTVDKRRFAGVQNVTLADGKVLLGPEEGGPFLVDERDIRFTAANDIHVKVTIEEAGPVRATIYATGFYTSDRAEKCNIFQTRITAYAGQSWLNVQQRTINTMDSDRKRLAQLGFALSPVGAEKYQFGFDGKEQAGALPQVEVDANKKPLPLQSVWLHQDRWDHLRIMQGDEQKLAEGKTSDGWAGITAANGSVGVVLRSIWQLFPKEIEISRAGTQLHFWPRHGHDVFADEQALDAHYIYQIRYAHQGKWLDLKMPQKYFDALHGYGPILENQDINAVTSNARGTAVTNDFALIFAAAEPKNLAAAAQVYQDNPHAITAPIYNGLTEVEGRFAGRDPKRFPEYEEAMDLGYRGYAMCPEVLQDYGMWIWPDTHNNWSHVDHYVQLHRWWNNSHYQLVSEGNLLYFRSGLHWIGRWAEENTRHFMDISSVNYDDKSEPMQGKLAGATYHTKGFLPWGAPRLWERTSDDYVEVGAHFIDPGAGLFRYLLVGDHKGLELEKQWFRALEYAALPPERSRECVTALGEVIGHYIHTWDPQAIIYMYDLANDMNSRPWLEVGAFPTHPLFHDRWVDRYWTLTRDPLLKQRLLECFPPDAAMSYGNLRVLLASWTGDKSYLTNHLAGTLGYTHSLYQNPADPLHGFGGKGLHFPTPGIAPILPYYMQGLIDHNIAVPPAQTKQYPVIGAVFVPQKDAAMQDWMPLPKGAQAWQVDVQGYLFLHGAQPTITLEIESYIDRRYGNVRSHVGYVRMEDADGKTLFETTVLGESLRPKDQVTLDGSKHKMPFKLVRNGMSLMKWTGPADAVKVAPTVEEAKAPVAAPAAK